MKIFSCSSNMSQRLIIEHWTRAVLRKSLLAVASLQFSNLQLSRVSMKRTQPPRSILITTPRSLILYVQMSGCNNTRSHNRAVESPERPWSLAVQSFLCGLLRMHAYSTMVLALSFYDSAMQVLPPMLQQAEQPQNARRHRVLSICNHNNIVICLLHLKAALNQLRSRADDQRTGRVMALAAGLRNSSLNMYSSIWAVSNERAVWAPNPHTWPRDNEDEGLKAEWWHGGESSEHSSSASAIDQSASD